MRLWMRNLPRQPIHADYVPRNILLNDQGIAAVLDFSGACVNLRALDVVHGAAAFAQARSSIFDWQLAFDFLYAYQAQQPLSERELEALPDLLRWRQFVQHRLVYGSSPLSAGSSGG